MDIYIQIDEIATGKGTDIDPYLPARPWSRIRLIIDGKQVDGADCETKDLPQVLNTVQMRNMHRFLGKRAVSK